MTRKNYTTTAIGASKNNKKCYRAKDKPPKLIVRRLRPLGFAVGFLWDMAARDVDAVHSDDILTAVRDYLKRRIIVDGPPLDGWAEAVADRLPAAIALLNSFESGVPQ